jgi:PAS domain-containing protein
MRDESGPAVSRPDSPRPSALRRYGAAPVACAVALGLALLLAGATGGRAGHLFTAAVVLAAWYGGIGPGLLASTLGGLAISYFFEEPPYSLWPDSPNTLLNVAVFLLAGVLIAWTSERLRVERDAHRAARAEVEALLDALDDSVIAYAADGRIARTNRAARERLMRGWGTVPATVAEMRAAVRPTALDGTPLAALPSEDALRGRPAAALLGYRGPDGRSHRFSVRAVPVPASAGGVAGAVAVWHEVTELHEVARGLGQVDGALKTVQRVLHELGNALAPAMGYSELLVAAGSAERATSYAELIGATVAEAASILERLAGVVRFEESEFGGTAMLDLDAASDAPS